MYGVCNSADLQTDARYALMMTLREELERQIDRYNRDAAIRLLSDAVRKEPAGFDKFQVMHLVALLKSDWPPLPTDHLKTLNNLEQIIRNTHSHWPHDGDPRVASLTLDEETTDQIVRQLMETTATTNDEAIAHHLNSS